jgi:AMP deaminase
VGFDCVDDETKYENFFLDNLKTLPINYQKKKNPHFAYWIYYFYSNLVSLNALRKLRGLNTFHFRPHCGEAGNFGIAL